MEWAGLGWAGLGGRAGQGRGLLRTHHSLLGSESSKLPSSCVPISLSYGHRAVQGRQGHITRLWGAVVGPAANMIRKLEVKL